jgi:DNA-binding protein WhiA
MSFSSDIKNELAAVSCNSPCCEVAQLYGMAEFGRAFSAKAVALQTESEAAAVRYTALLSSVCGITAEHNAPLSDKQIMHTVTVPSEACETVMRRFGHEGREVTRRLNRAVLDCDECTAAYLRGVFLTCGAVTNPQVDYHMEFSVPYYNLSGDLAVLLAEHGLHPRIVRRKGNYVVYFKESEQIEDCLTLMGAMNASLELMNIKMIKSIRNNVNRAANCENANIDKTVAAAFKQAEAVRKIERTVGLDSLPEGLREACRLRLENPDLSLRALGECFEPPLSRAGVNHRLQKIMEIAENL